MDNRVVWFDMPVEDLDRAMNFYSSLFDFEMEACEAGPDTQVAFFPFEPGVASGALVKSENSKASQQGALVYLNGGEDLLTPLSKVEQLGGKILQEKTNIGEHGFIAYFSDTEGNKVGLHSQQ